MGTLLVFILSMLSLGLVVYSSYKAFQLNKLQKQCIKIVGKSETWPLIEEQIDINVENGSFFPVEIVPIGTTADGVNSRMHKYLRMFIVSFESLLLITGVNLAFTPADHNNIQSDKVQQHENGKIAYRISDTMQIDSFYKVIASITKSRIDSILYGNIGNVGFKEHNANKITSRVSVSLIDPTKENFVINPLSSEEQIVDDSSNSIWRWQVKPTKGGNSELMLKVTLKILDELGNNQKDLSFIKSIIVKASFFKKVKLFTIQYWQYLSTAIIIPVLIFLRKTIWPLIAKRFNKINKIGFKLNNRQ